MSAADVYKPRVKECIINGNFLDGTRYVTGPLPPQKDMRTHLEKCFKICSDRTFRVILVEDITNYKVFIQLPGEKSECDFSFGGQYTGLMH